MATVFSQIINKELPGHFLWRDKVCVAFLSINPVRAGHSLVVPLHEVDHWLDLEPELVKHLNEVGYYIGLALQEVYKPARIGTMIAGFEVPHTHLHIMCIDSMADMDLGNSAVSVEPEELAEVAEKIRSVLPSVLSAHEVKGLDKFISDS